MLVTYILKTGSVPRINVLNVSISCTFTFLHVSDIANTSATLQVSIAESTLQFSAADTQDILQVSIADTHSTLQVSVVFWIAKLMLH